jgi:hypothetical protein
MLKGDKDMRTYHPDSWSVQAREMANRQVESINCGVSTIADAIYFFGISYRHPRIKYRAAKRFGRMRRTGKVKEKI